MIQSVLIEPILEQCLQDIHARRATVEGCLARYPEYADELAPLLRLAFEIKSLGGVRPSLEFKRGMRARLSSLQAPPSLGTRLRALFHTA